MKNCPFCGSVDISKQSLSATINHPAMRWMHCEQCGANGPMVTTDKRPEELWDQRPGEDEKTLQFLHAGEVATQSQRYAIKVQNILRNLVDLYVENRTEKQPYGQFIACITPKGIPGYWKEAVDILSQEKPE